MMTQQERFFKYLVASQSDKDWGIYVTDAGFSQIKPYSNYPPSGHPPEYDFSPETGRVLHSFQIVFITQGNGIFESTHGGKTIIEDGDIFTLFPNEWHRYQPDTTTGWNEHWVGFDGFYAHHLFHKGFIKLDSPVIKVGHDNYLVELFSEIIDIVKKEPFGFQKTIAAKTIQIIARLNTIKYFPQQEEGYIHEIINEAKYLAAESLSQHFDFESFAQKHGVSYSWFRQSFKYYTGFSPHQYMLELRINRAKKLLGETWIPIKQISYDLGFDTPYYFSRIFKNKTGCSPSEWRSHFKENLHTRIQNPVNSSTKKPT